MAGRSRISDEDAQRLRGALYTELSGSIDDNAVDLVCSSAVRWRRTGNVHFLLHAMAQCQVRGIAPVSATLTSELVAISAALMQGRRIGTPGQVTRMAVKESALFVMVSLRYAGLTVAQAASKAAAWSRGKGRPIKASSLEKYYDKEGKGSETHYFPQWDLQPTLRQEMVTFAESMPDAPTELLGERR